MRLLIIYLLFNIIESFYLHKVDMTQANSISYKYLKSQSYLNTDDLSIKVSEKSFQDIMKCVIYTSDILINNLCKDEYFVLYNSEDLLKDYGLCIYENINNTLYLKNIVINPYYCNKYSYLFKSFINLIAYNENAILNIDNLPYHLKLEYIINYGNEEL